MHLSDEPEASPICIGGTGILPVHLLNEPEASAPGSSPDCELKDNCVTGFDSGDAFDGGGAMDPLARRGGPEGSRGST